MTIAKSFVVSLTILALFGATMAATHNVGDNAGWTTQGVDYKQWAEGKQFQVGDTLVFKYNNAFHNVKQVSQQDFQSCNANAPISQHTSGLDSITLNMSGHHYFLCGTPGHCQAGMKVDINVLPASSSPSKSPDPTPGLFDTFAPSPSSGESPSTPAPSPVGSSDPSTPSPSSSAPSLHSSSFWLAAPGMVAVFLAGIAF